MRRIAVFVMMSLLFLSCRSKMDEKKIIVEREDEFEYVIDRFADLEIMRYKVDAWDELTLNQKLLAYYLSEAALCGRDILFDQNCKYNLAVKNTLYTIITTYSGEMSGPDWDNFILYAKRFWFSNGFHHHYSSEKFFPEVEQTYFTSLMDRSDQTSFPLLKEETYSDFKDRMLNIIFNSKIAPLKTSQDGMDLLAASSVNLYENVTQNEADLFYEKLQAKDKCANPEKSLSYGLNTKLVKNEKGKVVEIPYKIGGLYSAAIENIVYWLEKAGSVAENPVQQKHIEKLIEYYKTADLKIWDEYNVIWVSDLDSQIDYVNGFIEVYADPLGRKGMWEALVNCEDAEATKAVEKISNNAQWFEDHSPIASEFKKKEVKGVAAKVIQALQLGGDSYPATAIGINLPNADWIRKEYGSKSVRIQNIMYAYEQAKKRSGYTDEFYYTENDRIFYDKYGFITDNLQVDLHECLGHGSGQLLPGVNDGALKNYHSAIEETRADLFSLYFIADPKMVELDLLPNEEAYMACYYKYIMNGLMLQLNRIDLGSSIVQAHMRCRAIISNWCYEKGLEDNVIEKRERHNKTYIVINDYERLRELIGELLAEVQSIKSTGNFAAAKNLVENYGVNIDPVLHKEVKERYALLDMAPYGGFVNPVFIPEGSENEITDVRIEYVDSYMQQMLQYEQKYSYLK